MVWFLNLTVVQRRLAEGSQAIDKATRFGLSDNINTKGVMLIRGWKILLALGHVHVKLSKLAHCSWVLLTGVET